MELILKSGFLRKRKFTIKEEIQALIERISREYGLSEDELIRMSLEKEKIKSSGDANKIQALREEVDKLKKRMFILEGQWSSIKYRAHTLANDNKMLAVVLTGLLSQNKTLRRQLGLKREYDELRELVEYYLFQVRGSKL